MSGENIGVSSPTYRNLMSQGWPVDEPDIIVSTPAALLNYLRAIDSEKRRRSDILRGVKYVVTRPSPSVRFLWLL